MQNEPKEWSELWAAMKAAPTEWIETTEAMYWAMLECLPPRTSWARGFMVGEPERHDENGEPVHACFNREGIRFFARYMTLPQLRESLNK
jgi:hypothetical protein